MNILFFNRSFYPDLEATGQFLTELCEDLVNYGHNVTVICGSSYDETHKKDNYNLIEIIRACGTRLPKRFLFFRLINLGTYFLLAFLASFFVKNKPHVVVAQTDPPLLGLLGIFFSRWYKAKFIYACKDIYPDVGIVTGRLKNPVFNFILRAANQLSFKFADIITCLGEDMRKKIISKNAAENKIVVVHDWVDTALLYPVEKNKNSFLEKYNLKNNFVVMYSGNIGITQGLEKIVDVANYFKQNENIKFIFIGDGVNKISLEKKINNLELENILFLPYQPKEELKFSLSGADVHLITLEKGLAGIVVPSKVYGILACGKPFFAWVDRDSEIDNIAKKYNCGFVLPHGDIETMIEKIKKYVDNPEELIEIGKNARNVALTVFDRKIITEQFNDLIK